MQKFLNNPDDFVDEMLEGVLAAHPDKLRTAGVSRR
jgi:dihydroxyacetone kinase-like protein